MSDEQFKREFLLQPVPPEDPAVAALVLEYVTATEAYDRMVCGPTGRPRSPTQSRLINDNATRLRRRICEACGISEDEFKAALKSYWRRRIL